MEKKQNRLKQQLFLRKYCDLRERLVSFLRLPPGVSEAQIRLTGLEVLELPLDASDEQIAAHPVVRVFLTEERRRKLADLFGLSPNTSWTELKDTLERRRKEILNRSVVAQR